MDRVERAIEDLRSGKAILIHDSKCREDEVDMVYYAKYIDSSKIYKLRSLAGGLICFVTSSYVARVLGLRFMVEILKMISPLAHLAKNPRYGDPPAFTIWVNHVDVRTGISDSDRALTIGRLFRIVELVCSGDHEYARKLFLEEFMAPGHVPILVSRGLEHRRGHTELSIALAELGNMIPAMAIAEMLDKGRSLPLNKALEISRKLNITLVTGEDILSKYRVFAHGNKNRSC